MLCKEAVAGIEVGDCVGKSSIPISPHAQYMIAEDEESQEATQDQIGKRANQNGQEAVGCGQHKPSDGRESRNGEELRDQSRAIAFGVL
jgi:hypothetical protein